MKTEETKLMQIEKVTKDVDIMIDYLVYNGLLGCLPCQDDDESSGEIVLEAALRLKNLREMRLEGANNETVYQ